MMKTNSRFILASSNFDPASFIRINTNLVGSQ